MPLKDLLWVRDVQHIDSFCWVADRGLINLTVPHGVVREELEIIKGKYEDNNRWIKIYYGYRVSA